MFGGRCLHIGSSCWSNLARRLRKHARIDIAQRNHLDGRNLNQPEDVTLPIPPAPDQPDPFRLLIHERKGGPADNGQSRTGGATLKELTTVHSRLPQRTVYLKGRDWARFGRGAALV